MREVNDCSGPKTKDQGPRQKDQGLLSFRIMLLYSAIREVFKNMEFCVRQTQLRSWSFVFGPSSRTKLYITID